MSFVKIKTPIRININVTGRPTLPIPGADLRILRRGGGGVLGRNSSKGGVEKSSLRKFSYTDKQKKTLGGFNPLTPPPDPSLYTIEKLSFGSIPVQSL